MLDYVLLSNCPIIFVGCTKRYEETPTLLGQMSGSDPLLHDTDFAKNQNL